MLERPWYRQFWVWVMLAPPIAAVLAGIFTIVIAVKTADVQIVDPSLERQTGGPAVSATGGAVWTAPRDPQ